MNRLIAIVGSLIVAVIAMLAYAEYRRCVSTADLHEAVYRSDVAEVTRLLSASRHVDQRNCGEALGVRIRRYPLPYENDVTPLYVAASQSNPELVELLLRNGADPNLEFQGYDTILHRALVNLSPPFNIHGYDLSAEPPFDRAAAVEVLRLLVVYGAAINRRCRPDRETPLEMCNRLDEDEISENMMAWASQRGETSNTTPNPP